MAKRIPQSRRQGSPSASTKLPIFTLSGGVSRQAQSKRLPTEAQNIDNALISLERSFEKRPGFEIVTQNGFTGDISYTNTLSATYTISSLICTITKVSHSLKTGDIITIASSNGNLIATDYIITYLTVDTFKITVASGTTGTTCTYTIKDNVQFSQRLDLFPLEHANGTPKDYWFYWFNINENNRFLLAIDYQATAPTDVLVYVFRIRPDGTWSNETVYSNAPTNTQQDTTIINADTRAYITFGNATNQAKDVLKATTVGSSIIIVNTLVKAGFTSTDNTTGLMFNLDGTPFIDVVSTYVVSSTTLVTVTKATHGLINGNKISLTSTGSIANGVYTITRINDNSFSFPVVGATASGTVVSCTYTPIDIKGSRVVYYAATKYIQCSDNSWKLAAQTTANATIGWSDTTIKSGTVVTLATAPTLPAGVVHTVLDANSGSNVNPNTKTKIFVYFSVSKWMVLSGWQVGGLVWTVDSVSGDWSTGTNATTLFTGYYPEVEDFIWGDSSEPWYGQSLADFSEIRFPPEYTEVIGNNGLVYSGYSDSSAKTMLLALYGAIAGGSQDGSGKIYYTAAPYLNFGSGYYRVISSSSKPYTKKVRSPDSFSVLDGRRMPQKISFNSFAAIPWTANPIAWEPRTAGNRYTNPGPSIFLADDKVTPRQVSIKAVSTFRDRLYFAAEDVVFTSQLGIYEDLFLADPSNIVATDPIDIRASSNTFSEITSLTPFNTYLFINTLGNIQYELKGTQNEITPLTAEISPTAFYGTSKFLEPQLLGSLIYFLDSSKLYLYFSSESTNLAVAQELTVTCADYLPSSMKQVCTAPSQNSIAMIDNTNQNYIYFHMSRFAGDRNLQNAFFRYILNSNDLVMSNQSYDDYIYSVIARPTTQNTTTALVDIATAATVAATTTKRYTLERTYMRSLNENIPRLDRMFKLFLTANNSSYDGTLNQTTIKIPLSFNYLDVAKIQLITDSTWLDDVGLDRVYEIATPTKYLIKDKYIELLFTGRFVPASGTPLAATYTTPPTRSVYIGIKFRMEVELSTQFVRDQNNNPIDGVLSLRTITTRHKKTGNYDIEVSNRGRTSVVSSFTNQSIDTFEDVLNLGNIEEEGEFMTNVLGFSDSISLKIVSEYPTPCNIVNLEIKGKFIQKYSALTT
jgi:hypothetical protein